MPQFFIKVTPVPIAKVKAKYDKTMKKIRDFTSVNAKQAVFLDRWVQQNFKTEGGKVGGWAPFKYGGRLVSKTKEGKQGRVKNRSFNAQSVDSRKAIDGSAKLLRDTTRLQQSMLPFHSRRNAGIGSKLDYSKAHDEGIGVPQRRILPRHSDEDVITGLKKIYDRHVAKEINANWEGKF